MGSQDHGVTLNMVGFVLWVEALLSKIRSNQVRIWLKAVLNGKCGVVLCILGDVGHCGMAEGSLRNGTGMGTVETGHGAEPPGEAGHGEEEKS